MAETMTYSVHMDTEQSAARKSLEQYFGASRVGLFVIDSGARFSYVNERAARIFGYGSMEESFGQSISQLEFFFSQPLIEQITGLLRGNDALKVDRFPGTNLEGHFAYYCLSCNPIYNEDGRIYGVFGIIEDFTDQVRKRQELKRRIDELSILSQISQVVSSALDTEEVLKIILTGVTARQGLGFNRAFLFLLDQEQNYLTGRLAVGPANAEEAGKIWSALAQDDQSLLETLTIYQRETERGNTNLFDLIGGLRIDITNGSLFALSMVEKRPVIVTGQEQLDPVTERILGQMGERRVAMTPLISQDRPIGLLVADNAITKEMITEQDCQFLKLIADQSAAAVERSYLYRDLKERAIELEEMNVRLAETQNQIIEAEKMSVIGEITSAVAHELRNPLTIIGGFANLMYKNLAPGSPDAEYLNIIISETHRAEAVLTDVLDFSKASKTKDRCLDVNKLVNDTLDMMTIRLGNGRKRMTRGLSKSPLTIWGNEDQLLHAFYQVFYAVLQDLPENIIPGVTTYESQNTARLEICFQKAGGQAESIEKILRMYFGASKNTKRLSLLVAEETLKHHGGNLGIESSVKEGPILFVQLPLRKEAGNG